MNNHDSLEELSPRIKFAGNLVSGAIIIMTGIFLLLSGLGFFPFGFGEIIIPAILGCLGLILLFVGFIQLNTVSMWFSFVFLVSSAIGFTVALTSLKYSQLYPCYIAIPAVASFFTMLVSREFKAHLKAILFFGVVSLVFFLNSFKLLNWSITVPIIIVLIGLLILYFACKTKNTNEETTNE